MNLDRFKELGKKFENKNFEKDNGAIDKTLYYSSWFGNLLSVIFCFFFLNSLVDSAAIHFSGQSVVLPIFIIIFLVMFELLKRFVFAIVTKNVLTSKGINGKAILGVAFAAMLIVGSFSLSMSGAKHYVNKTEVITVSTDSLMKVQTIQLDSTYQVEIKKVEDKINYVYESAQTRRKTSLTRDEIKDIKAWEEQIKALKQEKNNKIDEVKGHTLKKQNEQLTKSNSSQFAFLILAAFIELLILIGVAFRQFFDFTSFKQMKEKIESNPNYKKLENYKQFLQIVYNNGKILPNTELPSMNKLGELINTKARVKVSAVTIREFLSVIQHLNIIYVSGKKKYTQMNYEKAVETLNNYMPLNDE